MGIITCAPRVRVGRTRRTKGGRCHMRFLTEKLNVIPGKERAATTVTIVALVIAPVLWVLSNYILADDLFSDAWAVIPIFFALQYVFMGFCKCSKPLTFRGHMIARWVVCVVLCGKLITSIILILTQGFEPGLLVYELILAAVGIQFLRNGYYKA